MVGHNKADAKHPKGGKAHANKDEPVSDAHSKSNPKDADPHDKKGHHDKKEHHEKKGHHDKKGHHEKASAKGKHAHKTADEP